MTNQDDTPSGITGDPSKKPETPGMLGDLSKKVEDDSPPGGLTPDAARQAGMSRRQLF